MELAPEKRQLHTQQRDERAELQGALDQLQADFHRELGKVQAEVRKKAFTHEITRARRYHEEKSIWEYLNNIVEDIHLFTWRKTAIATCTDDYQQNRCRLERELRNLDSQHRKERIILRYGHSTKSEACGSDEQPHDPHCFSQ